MKFNSDLGDKNDIRNVLHFIATRIGDPDDPETVRALWDEMLSYLTTDELRGFAAYMLQVPPETTKGTENV